MGDALIVGRGGSSSGGSSGKTLVTKIIQATQSWKVSKAKDQKFYVYVFGGGGGFVINSSYNDGGGGYGPSGTGGSQKFGYPDGGIAAGGAGGGQNMNSTGTPNLITSAGRGGNGICIIQYYA